MAGNPPAVRVIVAWFRMILVIVVWFRMILAD